VEKNKDIVNLIDFLSAENIVFANPSEFLARARQEGGACLTFGCDGHLNEKGHEAFARSLYGFIINDILGNN
jgi:hypothetical protein